MIMKNLIPYNCCSGCWIQITSITDTGDRWQVSGHEVWGTAVTFHLKSVNACYNNIFLQLSLQLSHSFVCLTVKMLHSLIMQICDNFFEQHISLKFMMELKKTVSEHYRVLAELNEQSAMPQG